MRRWGQVVAIVAAIILLADVVRLFVMPPAHTLSEQVGDITLEFHVDQQYVIHADDCVTLTWHVENAQTVVLDDAIVPASGMSLYCPESGLQETFNMPLPDNLLEGLTLFEKRQQDPQLLAYYNDHFSYIKLHLPVYVLLKDGLWAWRIALAMLLIAWSLNIRRPLQWFANRSLIPVLWMLLITFIGVLFYAFVFSDVLRFILAYQSFPENFGWTFARLKSLAELPVFIVVMTAYVAAALGLGSLLLYRFARTSSAAARLASTLVAGQSILALIWLVLGLLKALQLLPIWIVLSASILAGGIRHGTELWADIVRITQRLSVVLHRLSAPWKWILRLALILLGLFSLQSVLEPNADGPLTYMLNAKAFAVTGSLEPIWDGTLYYYSLSGLIGELHMAALLLLHGETAARFLAWFMLPAVVLLLLALADLLTIERRGKVLLLAMLVTSPVATQLAGNGKIGLYATAAALAAIYWTIHLKESPHAVLIGLFSGFTVMSKLTYTPLLALFIVLYSLYLYHHTPRYMLGLWVKIGLCAMLPISFHILRNSVVLGEPLMPFYLHSVDTVGISETFSHSWTHERIILETRILYPIFITFRGQITPLWLALLPLLFWRRPQNSHLRAIALITWGGLMLWLLLVHAVGEVRFVLAFVFLLFLPVVDVIPRLLRDQLFHRMLVAATLILLVVAISATGFSVIRTVFFTFPDTPECVSAACTMYKVVNDAAGPDDRVFSNYRKDYYLRDDLLRASVTRDERAEISALTPESRWTYLYEHGFVYIVDNLPNRLGQNVALNQYYKKSVPLYPDALPDGLSLTLIASSDMTDGKTRIYHLKQTAER
ncbi:MAG: hypothetical protein K8S97_16455 [Anaerolineae bacterium]|nr:hypothetical protein [Anaerolineae bacterium]